MRWQTPPPHPKCDPVENLGAHEEGDCRSRENQFDAAREQVRVLDRRQSTSHDSGPHRVPKLDIEARRAAIEQRRDSAVRIATSIEEKRKTRHWATPSRCEAREIDDEFSLRRPFGHRYRRARRHYPRPETAVAPASEEGPSLREAKTDSRYREVAVHIPTTLRR